MQINFSFAEYVKRSLVKDFAALLFQVYVRTWIESGSRIKGSGSPRVKIFGSRKNIARMRLARVSSTQAGKCLFALCLSTYSSIKTDFFPPARTVVQDSFIAFLMHYITRLIFFSPDSPMMDRRASPSTQVSLIALLFLSLFLPARSPYHLLKTFIINFLFKKK